MVYVYYDPGTKQVLGFFDTPNLADQPGWSSRGLSLALVPDGMGLDSLDFKVDAVINSDGYDIVTDYSVSVNPDTE